MNPAIGIFLKIGATFVFTLMLVIVKEVSDRIPFGEIVFARSFFALIPITAMLVWQGRLAVALRTGKPWLHASRGTVGVTAMILNFVALGFLPLPEAMTIGYAQPIIVVALAALILGETVRMFRWSAVALGFAGIVVILWPRLTLLDEGLADGAALGALLALASAIFSALAAIFVRSMVRTETTGSIVFYFAVWASLISLATIPFGWTVPSASDAVLLVACGLLGGIGQIMMTVAFRYAQAATIASFEYVSILWGYSLGYLIFGEVPSGSVLWGGAIVVAAGIIIILRERQLGLQRARQRRASAPPPAH